jgi:hypothetical protein
MAQTTLIVAVSALDVKSVTAGTVTLFAHWLFVRPIRIS